jgi:hypothetical protein
VVFTTQVKTHTPKHIYVIVVGQHYHTLKLNKGKKK